MSKSEAPEDRSLCELLKIVTAPDDENSEEKSEQSEVLACELSQYLDDYSSESDMAQWDKINLQPLVAGEERLGGDESSIEEIGLKGGESSIEEIGLKGDESSIEEIEVKGDDSSREVIEIKSDESCTEMAATKTDEDNLNDAQESDESDERTIKRNKQRALRTRIAVLKMNICRMRAQKLHVNLFSEDDEDLKSETDTTGTTNNTFTENSDTSTSTDLDYFSFKNSDDSTTKTYSANISANDVEQKPMKKRKTLRWRRLRHREKSEDNYYEDYDDNESVR